MTAATKELDSSRERLAAIARAYVSGGVNNPALYRCSAAILPVRTMGALLSKELRQRT
jgi:hypothetical protein